jgi:RNA polymerase sigma-70 factor, ECF subfamily
MNADGRLSGEKLNADEVKRLYERHGPALVAYACGFGLDWSSAEDVVHGVFHRVLRSAGAAPQNPAGYLYRAVRNAALNTRRDRSRRAALHEEHFVHEGGNREAALALQKALASLPGEQREVVIMRIWSGMTLDEIAKAHEVPLNTIASRYRYALEKLREALRPREVSATRKLR